MTKDILTVCCPSSYQPPQTAHPSWCLSCALPTHPPSNYVIKFCHVQHDLQSHRQRLYSEVSALMVTTHMVKLPHVQLFVQFWIFQHVEYILVKETSAERTFSSLRLFYRRICAETKSLREDEMCYSVHVRTVGQ